MGFSRERIEYKTLDQIRVMRKAGLVVAAIHEAIKTEARAGMTTANLDAISRRVLASHSATSNFLGYDGFPATICVSVNDEVVHGIPGPRILHNGDVISVDAGAIVKGDGRIGWHGDAAQSWILGVPDEPCDQTLIGAATINNDKLLVCATEAAMWAGIAALAQGRKVGDVGVAVERTLEVVRTATGRELGIVTEYEGHGIGTAMHQPPGVPNYACTSAGPKLRVGMCLAIEPMITLGTGETRDLDDGWTVVTTDGTRAAHFEHTVAILPDGITVLTAPDAGVSKLAPLGVEAVVID
ncbi:MAG: type I methionyl aminopeptidase [Cellulomonadaceae bacterium]|jgi:methionyl aminopeptidase|nr:type I methionyl aminopeptidase [Cellulomonadaceae bacterium]